jgi:hypothetical protein
MTANDTRQPRSVHNRILAQTGTWGALVDAVASLPSAALRNPAVVLPPWAHSSLLRSCSGTAQVGGGVSGCEPEGGDGRDRHRIFDNLAFACVSVFLPCLISPVTASVMTKFLDTGLS